MKITLKELLDAREERVRVQNEMLKRHNAPLICFTMNVAGEIKTSPLIERAFDDGTSFIREAIEPYEVAEWREKKEKCGPVLFCSVRADAVKIKKLLTEIEYSHPIGRLFDMDVIDTDGKKLTRACERGCMVCGAPGRACAAGRLHPLSELVELTDRMMTDYFSGLDAERIGRMAKESLLAEVYTAIKPGLVDPVSRGSHKDMGVLEFERSAEALEGYFTDCAKVGIAYKNEPNDRVFTRLRELGIEAEKRMYLATGGVNTHKGIIFSMGILACAVGRLITPAGYMPNTDVILAEVSEISRDTVRRDFDGIDGSTAGGKLYIESGLLGIRGEVMDGFPSVKSFSLPAYKKALAEGKNKNDAGVFALLHLIANVYDTSIYNRGGDTGVTYAQEYAKGILSSGEPTGQKILKMDADFTERNLSPGGCADLLAITYFLAELGGRD